jgi:ketosteroid isomerase-like protein
MKKNLTYYFVAFCILAGCNPANEKNEAYNIELVQKMYTAFNNHDWQKMSLCYADSAYFLDPSLGTLYLQNSRSNIVNKYKELEKLFPDIHDEVITIQAKGDKVFVEFIATGNSGDSINLRLPIASVLTIKDQLIIKDATYYNNCQ